MVMAFYHYYTMVTQGENCKISTATSPNADCCNALTLGLLTRGFLPLGKCSLEPMAEDIHCSVMYVYKVLTNIKLYNWTGSASTKTEPTTRASSYSYNSHNNDAQEHVACNLQPLLVKKVTDARQSIPSPVLESHRIHMRKQWNKGNPEPVPEPVPETVEKGQS
jgi:hypothetical protein